jgi:hypothetical protein
VTVPVVADADTLYPAATRGLLVQLDLHGLIHLHWSPLLLDEAVRALVKTGRRPTLADARAHAALLCEALPRAMLHTRDVQSQFEAVGLAVNSAKDMHVAACAHWLVATRVYPDAQSVVLVSGNQRDFRKRVLARLGITLRSPDALLLEMIAAQPGGVLRAFQALLDSLPSRPDALVLLDKLRRDGQTQTARALLAALQTRGDPWHAGDVLARDLPAH